MSTPGRKHTVKKSDYTAVMTAFFFQTKRVKPRTEKKLSENRAPNCVSRPGGGSQNKKSAAEEEQRRELGKQEDFFI